MTAKDLQEDLSGFLSCRVDNPPPPPSPLCYLVVLSEPQQIRDDEVILLKISKISHLLLYAIWKSGHLLSANLKLLTLKPLLQYFGLAAA